MKKELFKQTWWDNNLNNSDKFSEYLGWLGNSDAESRNFIRENIKDLEIKSFADFGCGPCVEYTALTEDGYEFEYMGIDSCVHLKEYNMPCQVMIFLVYSIMFSVSHYNS